MNTIYVTLSEAKSLFYRNGDSHLHLRQVQVSLFTVTQNDMAYTIL